MRITCSAYMTAKKNGVSDGIYEVVIDGMSKFLPLNELKEKSGIQRVNSRKKIEAWLNTDEGYCWAKKVKSASIW